MNTQQPHADAYSDFMSGCTREEPFDAEKGKTPLKIVPADEIVDEYPEESEQK
jgi:hypothetical protein